MLTGEWKLQLPSAQQVARKGRSSVLPAAGTAARLMRTAPRVQVTHHERCRFRVTVLEEPGKVPQQGHKASGLCRDVRSFSLVRGCLLRGASACGTKPTPVHAGMHVAARSPLQAGHDSLTPAVPSHAGGAGGSDGDAHTLRPEGPQRRLNRHGTEYRPLLRCGLLASTPWRAAQHACAPCTSSVRLG